MSKRGGRGYAPNDMRSMALNPNSAAFRAAQVNRANQLNPLSATFAASRGQPAAPAAQEESELDDHAVEDFGGPDED